MLCDRFKAAYSLTCLHVLFCTHLCISSRHLTSLFMISCCLFEVYICAFCWRVCFTKEKIHIMQIISSCLSELLVCLSLLASISCQTGAEGHRPHTCTHHSVVSTVLYSVPELCHRWVLINMLNEYIKKKHTHFSV